MHYIDNHMHPVQKTILQENQSLQNRGSNDPEKSLATYMLLLQKGLVKLQLESFRITYKAQSHLLRNQYET
jgi:hypothetical protein